MGSKFVYEIELNYKVVDCNNCPFKSVRTEFENIESQNILNGTVGITKRTSYCLLRGEFITKNEPVNSYTTRCPLNSRTKNLD